MSLIGDICDQLRPRPRFGPSHNEPQPQWKGNLGPQRDVACDRVQRQRGCAPLGEADALLQRRQNVARYAS